MPKLFTLTQRLSACASLVREGASLIDIGTDHGYLPIWLLKSGKINKAIAADIGEGPLLSAKTNAKKYEADLECILSDGFKSITGDSFNTAVIAGMGGELISKILSEAPFEIDESKTFILQPMTAAKELREYLYKEGYSILTEITLKDMGKIYSVMKVQRLYKKEIIDETYFYMGKIEPFTNESEAYALKVINSLNNTIKGYEHKGDSEGINKTYELINKIKEKYLK